jgi:hypothetical protein
MAVKCSMSYTACVKSAQPVLLIDKILVHKSDTNDVRCAMRCSLLTVVQLLQHAPLKRYVITAFTVHLPLLTALCEHLNLLLVPAAMPCLTAVNCF